MEKTVKQRLMEFAEFRNLSISKFESLCGLGNGYVGKLKSEPGSRKLEDILKAFPELNRAWLLFGEGEMLKSNAPTTPIIKGDITIGDVRNSNISNVGHGNNYVIRKEIEEAEYVEIECPSCGTVVEVPSTAILPLVPVEVARQPDTNLEFWRENHPQEMQEVDLRKIWGGGVFLMRVDTRAMEPEYREGTFLVLRKLKDPTYARADGSAYVIDTLKPHTLFRYLSKERDGNYILSAENDKRGPIYLAAADILNIYDIVGSFRIGR